MYGVAEDTLFRIDRDNANVELVGGIAVGSDRVVALAFDPSGRLFAATSGGVLLILDTQTALALSLGDIGFGSGGDLAFSRDGTLYMSTTLNELVKINANQLNSALTTDAELIGPTGTNNNLFGLAFDNQDNLFGVAGNSL